MSFAAGDYGYTITSDTAQLKTCTVTGFSGPDIAAVVIPVTATNATTGKTYNVTEIGANAFAGKIAIESITITEITDPFVQGTNSLTIGAGAFAGITTLAAAGTTITIPTQVVSINEVAFFNTNLTSLAFTATSNCTTIGNSAFDTNDTSTLAGALTIPNTVTSIGQSAFYAARIASLTITDIGTNATLSTNTLTIGTDAFSDNAELNSPLTIPRQVTVIGASAFSGTSLTGLLFGANSKCTTIGNYAFSDCSNLVGELAPPATLTSIGQQAFEGTGLETLTLVQPTNPLLIGAEAFLNVSTLNKPNPFALPAGVTAAPDAFEGTGLVFGPPAPGQQFTSGGKRTKPQRRRQRSARCKASREHPRQRSQCRPQ